MMIGSRQIKYGCANVPPIEFNDQPDIEGYEPIICAMSDAIRVKYNKMPTQQDVIDSCITQTISFLKSIDAIKSAPVIHKIELWNEYVQMSPFYEGITSALQSTIIKKHNPRTWSELEKGAVYGSLNLDIIRHSILYVMEYFQKENLFNEVAIVIDNDKVKKWFDDRMAYEEEHKEELAAKKKANDEERKRREQEFEDFVKASKDGTLNEYMDKKYGKLEIIKNKNGKAVIRNSKAGDEKEITLI